MMLTLDGRPSPTMPSLAGSYANMNADKQIRAALQREQLHHRHMWIITGPAGCGKSSVAEYLAKELAIPFIEGDDVSNLCSSPAPLLTTWVTVPLRLQQAENGQRRSPYRRRPLGLAYRTPRSCRGSTLAFVVISSQSPYRRCCNLLRTAAKIPRCHPRCCLCGPQCGCALRLPSSR